MRTGLREEPGQGAQAEQKRKGLWARSEKLARGPWDFVTALLKR